MRLLANENIPGEAVAKLRQRGYDVLWVREESPGINDLQVLNRAQREERILITFDKDFGELAFRYGLPASCGIILFRISTPSPDRVANRAMLALELREDWAGHFSVIEDNRIRMTPLPGTEA